MHSNPVQLQRLLGPILAGCLLLAGGFTSRGYGDETAGQSVEDLKFFENKVRPILVEHCIRCHGEKAMKGKLRLDSRAAVLAGGESGPVVVHGKPDESLLIDAIHYNSYEMPPDGKLSDEKIADLTEWVRRGLPWPSSPTGAPLRAQTKLTDEDRAYWFFQPLRDAPPPLVADDGWARNDVDRFVWEKLAAAGLRPAAEADRRTLIRRACFDLHGLPPAPEEVARFVADDSPQAYERLIDRLLESPRYGERWARHWLDLVRYAESDGFRQDAYRPTAWRYRDYVIRSFNDDKPYDQFVREQLAGDELAPPTLDGLAATSFLRHWIYEYNQRDVRTQWHNILNDVTDVSGEVFLGLSVGCARCHDHKFDPILQKDYFRFQAFFAPLLPRDDVPFAPQNEVAAYQQQWSDWEARTAAIRQKMAVLEQPTRRSVEDGAIDKFPPDIRPMLRKAPAERTPYEHQLAELAYRQVREELDKIDFSKKLTGETKVQWEALRKELAELESLKPVALPVAFTVTDVSATAPSTKIPDDKTGGEIAPGILSVLDESPLAISDAPPGSTGRRTALANWIVRPDNQLATRVIANRLWQYHFGRGLVGTSNDFGRLGDAPSHPELLDWLAQYFTRQGWRFKEMHRLIMTSATYRQSAHSPIYPVARERDPENRLVWRRLPRRLDAEQIRDSLLAVSGELNLEMFGPSADHSSPRRTIFTKVLRNTVDPLLEVFDCPDGFNSTAQRNATTTPTQSLLMINGPWPLDRAKVLARRIDEPGMPFDELVRRAYREVFGREPDTTELDRGVGFLRAQSEAVGPEIAATPTFVPSLAGRSGRALDLAAGSASACRLQVRNRAMLPPGDFTIEAFVQLRDHHADASVLTIAAQWDGNTSHPGWALGVTSQKSKYKPSNLILQVVSGDGAPQYEVIPSNLFLELNKSYFVAAAVKAAEQSPSVTFYVQELPAPQAGSPPMMQKAEVVPGFKGLIVADAAFTLGGRDKQSGHQWLGVLDEVRLSNAVLAEPQLLVRASSADAATVGFWRFDEPSTWNRDASPRGNDVSLEPLAGDPARLRREAAIVDLCHVLLNSSEFIYVD